MSGNSYPRLPKAMPCWKQQLVEAAWDCMESGHDPDLEYMSEDWWTDHCCDWTYLGVSFIRFRAEVRRSLVRAYGFAR